MIHCVCGRMSICTTSQWYLYGKQSVNSRHTHTHTRAHAQCKMKIFMKLNRSTAKSAAGGWIFPHSRYAGNWMMYVVSHNGKYRFLHKKKFLFFYASSLLYRCWFVFIYFFHSFFLLCVCVVCEHSRVSHLFSSVSQSLKSVLDLTRLFAFDVYTSAESFIVRLHGWRRRCWWTTRRRRWGSNGTWQQYRHRRHRRVNLFWIKLSVTYIEYFNRQWRIDYPVVDFCCVNVMCLIPNARANDRVTRTRVLWHRRSLVSCSMLTSRISLFRYIFPVRQQQRSREKNKKIKKRKPKRGEIKKAASNERTNTHRYVISLFGIFLVVYFPCSIPS